MEAEGRCCKTANYVDMLLLVVIVQKRVLSD
jgi:hypothetical protein